MADIPGPGVLMHGGIDESVSVVQDLWMFDPEGGWTSLPLGPEGEAVAPSAQLTFDPTTGLVWLLRPSDEGTMDAWSYEAAGGWAEIGSKDGPPDAGYKVALDTGSHRLIAFTNCFDIACEAQTWTFDTETHAWTEMTPKEDPGGRMEPLMSYDAGSDRVILFGGIDLDAEMPLADTWAYDVDTDTWTEMEPTHSPPPSSHAFSMVYDPVTDRSIFFGGQVGTLGYDDPIEEGSLAIPFTAIGGTWAYDHDADEWTPIWSPHSPSARELSGLAYDAETGLIVLFSGGHAATTPNWTTYTDTWLFDPVANTWTEWSAGP